MAINGDFQACAGRAVSYCRHLFGERNWDCRTAFGRHPSRCAGYFGTPDILLVTRTLRKDSAWVPHIIYRTMEPVEDFLRDSPHILNLRFFEAFCDFLMPSTFGEFASENPALRVSDTEISEISEQLKLF